MTQEFIRQVVFAPIQTHGGTYDNDGNRVKVVPTPAEPAASTRSVQEVPPSEVQTAVFKLLNACIAALGESGKGVGDSTPADEKLETNPNESAHIDDINILRQEWLLTEGEEYF